jgi:hypothetical protein
MKKFFAVVFACLLWVAPTRPAVADSELFARVDSILSELAQITGLQPLKPVERATIARSELKRFLEDRIREELKPEEIRAEEITLKMFGFVPAGFDLKATTVELLTEQAAAFYDYRKKKLYVLDTDSAAIQEIALVHELAHALADQHFNLSKYIAKENNSDDGAMARMAVMEGQATWLMSEFLARRMNLSLKKTPAIAEAMSLQTAAASGQFPVFEKAPLYIRETMLFPYVKGMLFQQAIIEKQDQAAFASVFRSPPAGTFQILHPEKYLAGERPSNPALPKLRAAGRYRELAGGSIGELDHWILLTQYAGAKEAAELAPRWKGGRYRVLESRRKRDSFVLLYVSEWTDAAAAREYFQNYRRVLTGKWTTFEVASETQDSLSGRGDGGYFTLTRTGAVVASVEGMEDPRDATAR